MLEFEQAAFLLHSKPYRENQQILSLLTEQHGMVAAITYVGHGKNSKRKGLLQPFTPLTVVLKGNSTLKNLTRVEPRGKSLMLNHYHLYSGFYVNELLVRLLEESIACESLYHCYQQTLTALADRGEIEPLLRQFELSLLEELGLIFDFSPIDELSEQHFCFVPETGFIAAELYFECYNKKAPVYSRESLAQIAQLIEGDHSLMSNKLVMSDYKKLMRQVFDQLLGPKPLNSRKLFVKNKRINSSQTRK